MPDGASHHVHQLWLLLVWFADMPILFLACHSATIFTICVCHIQHFQVISCFNDGSSSFFPSSPSEASQPLPWRWTRSAFWCLKPLWVTKLQHSKDCLKIKWPPSWPKMMLNVLHNLNFPYIFERNTCQTQISRSTIKLKILQLIHIYIYIYTHVCVCLCLNNGCPHVLEKNICLRCPWLNVLPLQNNPWEFPNALGPKKDW